jgi:hypothetical protein
LPSSGLTGLETITIDTLAEKIYEGTSGNSDTVLLVEGRDLEELVNIFEETIPDCITSNDFTEV